MAMATDFTGAAVSSEGTALIQPFSHLTERALGNIRRVYEALTPSRDALALLFAVDAAQTDPTDQWLAFFVETASAQLIWDERPTGSLSDADALWAIARFDEAPTLAAMSILIRLVEEAQRLPAWFTPDVRQRAELFGTAPLQRRAEPAKRPAYLRLVA